MTPPPSLPTDQFVGRAAELAALDAAYRGRDSAFVPIYGRRRVGKSELIMHLLRDRPGLYHVGKLAPAPLQLRELLDDAARLLDEPLIAALPDDDWRRALDTIVDRWRSPRRLILALDEFQWTAQAAVGLPSILQELWDRKWRRSGKVMLILCGSFIGFMEREVLGQRSPLYGRRTAQIKLAPFGYREAAAFHPRWSAVDRAAAYFLCGGVPLYLRAFDPARSVRANVEANLLSEYAALYREPEFLLREELRDVQSYHAVLWAIAGGHHTQRAIAGAAGLPERSLHYWLEQLIQLGYVSRRYPMTGARPRKRDVRYVVDDPLLRFWFRFVFPHRSFIQQRGPRAAWQELIAGDLDAYFGGCFERLCREALPHLYARDGVAAPAQVGEYWDRDVQIDVVGVRGDGWTDLGECKWGAVRSGPALVAELEAKVGAYPNPRNATIGRHLFVRTRPRATPEGAIWHDLADLYDA
ncbi:MAG: ATP-binding protein [Kofleriaceae bacterium]|nr:ATP-binding protein [Myxococcales bacterium]MCB9559285.1 ATP-binding protein [Kofleriaceae bacterium]